MELNIDFYQDLDAMWENVSEVKLSVESWSDEDID
jgi:hypothetical protein